MYCTANPKGVQSVAHEMRIEGHNWLTCCATELSYVLLVIADKTGQLSAYGASILSLTIHETYGPSGQIFQCISSNRMVSHLCMSTTICLVGGNSTALTPRLRVVGLEWYPRFRFSYVSLLAFSLQFHIFCLVIFGHFSLTSEPACFSPFLQFIFGSFFAIEDLFGL